MFSKFLKFISLTLILTLIFTSMPMDGFAALAEQAIEESKLITVVEELEQYRSEFTKTYLKSDGTLESVVSSAPIHFMDNGEWVEIDSTLESDKNEKGVEILKNKKGSFNVELPTEIQNDSEIAIEKGKNKISIKLLETKNSKAKKNKDKKEKAEKITKSQRKRMTAGELFEVDNNQTSTVEYSAVYSDTNIRYDVTPNEVKESIVLQKAPNKKAAYSYEISAKGLTAVLNKDNSIDFYEGVKSESATPVFSMPSPYMFDSKGEYSYDIATTLENKNGKYILTYKPSYEWLKDKNRAYPVTVDPTVVINSGVQAAYTYSAESYLNTYLGYEQQLKVGNSSWQSEKDSFYTYLKFTDLPLIPYEDYRIDSAYLMLTPGATGGTWDEMELGVYELTEDWKTHKTGTRDERITYNNSPEDVGYATATATVSRGGADNGVGVGFEIAHIVKNWCGIPDSNFGIKLAAHLDDSQNNANIVFYSTAATASGKAPYLSLTYSAKYDNSQDYILLGNTKEVIPFDSVDYISAVEDPTVLSTDGKNITALKKGTTKIYIKMLTYPDAPICECIVTVFDYSEFDFYDIDMLNYGETYKITQNPNTELHTNDIDKIEITSSNTIKTIGIGWVTIDVYYSDVLIKTLRYYVIESITITGKPANNTISVGDTYTSLGAVYAPTNVAHLAEWSSSDESIAEVYYDLKSGQVFLIGKSKGAVWISIKSTDYANPTSDSFLLNVDFAVTSFYIDYYPDNPLADDNVLYINESGVFQADIYPSPDVYYNEIEWYVKEGDKNCVRFKSIVENGIVKKDSIKIYATRPGKVEISAKIDNSIEAEISYSLEIRDPSSIITVPTNHIIRIGTEHTFNAEIIPEYAVGIWDSSNKSVGIIDSNGVFEALSNGETNISLSYEVGGTTYTNTVKICVSNVGITNVPGNRILFVDGIRVLEAMAFLNNATSSDIVWTTSDSNIATVSSSTGEIIGKKAGKVTITAKYKNDTSQKAWVTITVKKTKSYIFYLNTEKDNWKLNNQLYAKIIADTVYGANTVAKNNVEMFELKSSESFCANWNNMGNDCEIGYVLIDCHANPSFFSSMPNDNSIDADTIRAERDVTDLKQLYFEEKEMCGLISLGCNSGHLDYRETNLASALAQKVCGAPVLASDGTVIFWGFEQGETIGDADDWNKKFCSLADDTFLYYCIEEGGYKRTINQGWMIYSYISSTIRTVNVEETEKDTDGNITGLFLNDMLELLSHY